MGVVVPLRMVRFGGQFWGIVYIKWLRRRRVLRDFIYLTLECCSNICCIVGLSNFDEEVILDYDVSDLFFKLSGQDEYVYRYILDTR